MDKQKQLVGKDVAVIVKFRNGEINSIEHFSPDTTCLQANYALKFFFSLSVCGIKECKITNARKNY